MFDIYEEVLWPKHSETATILYNFGIIYNYQGEYEEAETLFYRALAIREEALRPKHPDTVYSLHNLANLYKAKGKYEYAESLYKSYKRRSAEVNAP